MDPQGRGTRGIRRQHLHRSDDHPRRPSQRTAHAHPDGSDARRRLSGPRSAAPALGRTLHHANHPDRIGRTGRAAQRLALRHDARSVDGRHHPEADRARPASPHPRRAPPRAARSLDRRPDARPRPPSRPAPPNDRRRPTRRACGRRSKPTNCGSTISRRSPCAPAPSSRWKRSCAGSIRSAG